MRRALAAQNSRLNRARLQVHLAVPSPILRSLVMTWMCAAEAGAETRDPLPAAAARLMSGPGTTCLSLPVSARRDSASDSIPNPPESMVMIEKTVKTRGFGGSANIWHLEGPTMEGALLGICEAAAHILGLDFPRFSS